MYGFNIRLVNVYAPTDTGNKEEKDMFYRAVNKACKTTDKRQKLILLGDFNAKTSLAYKSHTRLELTSFLMTILMIMGHDLNRSVGITNFA